MEDAVIPHRKTILPGIRGVLIAVLVYLVFQVLVSVFVCTIVLLGFGHEPDYLGTEFDADMQLVTVPLGWADYAVMVFDVLVSFTLLAAWVYVLALFLKRRRRFLFSFLTVIAIGPVSGLLSFVLLYVLLGSVDSTGAYGGGSGIPLALGVYLALIHSSRTQAVFAN